MPMHCDSESFTLDLRNYRAREMPPLDGWTAHASPFEHRLMVERGGDVDAWADHLTRCDNCRRQQMLTDIYSFASARHRDRVSAA